MAAHMINSLFFRDLFGTEKMRRIFSDENLLQKWLEVEAALARAEARLGIIPPVAAEEITRRARVAEVDLTAIQRGMAESVHPLMPVIQALSAACAGEAGEYVHWGATTQDIMDTATVLQLAEAASVLQEQMGQVRASLARLARHYRDTPMAGRTHGQHAVPITFGFKVAVWLSEWQRHTHRLAACCTRVCVGQLGGAAGTLATLPEHGLAVQAALMENLGLDQPEIAWHTARDNLAEWCLVLALIAGTCGKIARELITLQKTEVGEVEEPFHAGKIGSSTMPHKRNPMLCEAVVALSQTVRGNASTALLGLPHEHERDMGPWQAEWQYLPEITTNVSGCLALLARVLEGLVVYPERMRQNLALSQGLVCSEAVMIRLAEYIGRQRAHEVVSAAAMLASEQGLPFKEALLQSTEVRAHLDAAALDSLLEPTRYVGLAPVFVDRVLARAETPEPAES